MRMHVLWMAAVLLAAAPAGAQVVSGSARNARTGQPVEYAAVTVSNTEGVVVASSQVDAGGRFTLHLPSDGEYVLRIEEPGFRPVSSRFHLAPGRSYSRHFRLSETNWSASSIAEQDPIGKQNGRPVADSPRGTTPTFTPPSTPPG